MVTMYACKTGRGTFELRQTRYKDQRNTHNGEGHPHDVCAVATSVEELRSMTIKHWPDADFTQVEAP